MWSHVLRMVYSIFFPFHSKPGKHANVLVHLCWVVLFHLYQGMCMWKAKSTSIGSGTTIVESQSTKPGSDSHSPDVGPGNSFRNFRFDTAAILQAMEAGFSAWCSKLVCILYGWVTISSALPNIINHPDANLVAIPDVYYLC